MNSAFFEFNVATSALFTAKNGLSVTSNNIANASTKGYSRQVVLQRASTPLPGVCGKGMIGTGSEVYGVDQVREFYLDKKYWEQNATYGEYKEKNDQLELVETIFNELASSGIASSVNDFFNSISGLTFSSGDGTYRTSVVNYTYAFAQNINTYAETLKSQQSDINDEVNTLVKKINSISDQIVSLNKQIYSMEIDGSHANDLRDQRALLVDELSQYVNTEVSTVDTEYGEKFYVSINGQSLVSHFDNSKLECVSRTDKTALDEDDVYGLYDIQWSSKIPFSTTGLSGDLKGLLDLRDGNVLDKTTTGNGTGTGDDADADKGIGVVQNYKGIPYYIDRLNEFTQTIARAFNEGKYADGTDIKGIDGHINGYDSYGNTGNLFFSYKGEDGKTVEDTELDYSKITAFNFSVSDALLKDSKRLAASTSASSEESNNEIILQFTQIKNENSLFKQGNVLDFVNGVSSELAIDKKQSENFDAFYEEMTLNTDNQRISVSGVSLNEEMTSLIKYQQLYVASAKLMQSISQIYDTTINGLGV